MTREVIVTTNDSYINAQSVGELILNIAKSVSRSGMLPITLVLDNARYQKCEWVHQVVAVLCEKFQFEIELLYLPSYSPNLNLIERYWKFVKKEVLYSRHYDTFDNFKAAISQCIAQPDEHQKRRLKSLLTWNFQSFKKVQVSAV